MRRSSLTLGLAVTALSAAAAFPASAFESQRLITGVSSPVWVGAPEGDSRLFVVEKAGYIELFDQNGTFISQFLNIDSRVSAGSERGLFTIAFSPDYATNGFFFLNYTNNAGGTVISRFEVTADPNVADPLSEVVFMTFTQPFSNHNGGRMLFGPDGYLYIGTGDGGSGGDPGNRAQQYNTLLGKLLRIDVSGSAYTIPADNPFVIPGDGRLDEIWANGVRNPWGMDFDPADGSLYWADVGQNAWEELNVQPGTSTGGENYGWRLMEGTHCYNPSSECEEPGLVLPVHEYSHGGGRCSVTGGIIYRGDAIPELDGHYFFADYCSNDIWSYKWDGAGGITDFTSRRTELIPDAGSINTITAICRDGLGEMYIVDGGGEVFKVVDAIVDTPETVPGVLNQIKVRPNPFQTSTVFELGLSDASEAVVTIFDLKGAKVRTWSRGEAANRLQWDGTDDADRRVSPGVYYVQVQVGEAVSRSRVTLVK